MKRIVAAALVAWLPASANAQEASACVGIGNDLDRLACYDKAVGRTPTIETVATASNWRVATEKSDFQDTTDVFLSVSSEEPVACGFMGAKEIVLYARCVENKTALIISTHCHVASGFGGYGNVEYRIDDNPARKLGFDESTNNRSLGLWNGSKSIPVLKSMFGGQELLVRFTPFNENPVTAKFNIAGLEEAIAPLRESCHW